MGSLAWLLFFVVSLPFCERAPRSLSVPPHGRPTPLVVKEDEDSASRIGLATFYARALDGRRTASGTTFNANAMVAAHPTFPFGTVVRVTNLRNGRSVHVRIVDRGPVWRARGRGVIIDLSPAAARSLGFVRRGRERVRLDVVQ